MDTHSLMNEIMALRAEVERLKAEDIAMRHAAFSMQDEIRRQAKRKLDAALLLVDGLRKAFTEATIAPGGDCRTCGATLGLDHYPDSPCKILNPVAQKKKCERCLHLDPCEMMSLCACLCHDRPFRESLESVNKQYGSVLKNLATGTINPQGEQK